MTPNDKWKEACSLCQTSSLLWDQEGYNAIVLLDYLFVVVVLLHCEKMLLDNSAQLIFLLVLQVGEMLINCYKFKKLISFLSLCYPGHFVYYSLVSKFASKNSGSYQRTTWRKYCILSLLKYSSAFMLYPRALTSR